MRDERNLKKIYVDGWTWHIVDPEILTPWFSDFKKYLSLNKVKSNELRDVFRMEANGVRYYVKYNHPVSLFSKLRSSIIPQAELEFESAELLSSMDIPVVEMCGWGKKGPESLLISREFEGAINARDFWFASVIENESEKKLFLDGFADFLKHFLASRVYHPDFHLGNLLFKKESKTFVFVDPYGIKKLSYLKESQRLRILKVVGALRGELSDSEAVAFIERLEIFEEPQHLWFKILQLCSSEVERLWPKRRGQVLSGNSKYCVKRDYPDFSCLVRKSMQGLPFLTDEQLKDFESLSTQYDLERCCCRAKAESFWLRSFKFQFHRIRHRMPLAWIKKEQGNDILIWQKIGDFEEPDENSLKEFIRRCEFSGIKIEGLKKNIKKVNGDLKYDINE